MSIVYLLIPLSLGLAGFFVWLFIRSVNEGQFQDLETPGRRIIFEETIEPLFKENASKNQTGENS